MFTLKLGMAALTAVGIVASAAGILVYQEPAAPAPAAEPRADGSRSIAALAHARYDLARRFLEQCQVQYAAGKVVLGTLRASALRVLEAQRDLDATKSNEIAALEAYLGVIKKAETAEKTGGDPDGITEAEYDRLEAQLWLARARAGKNTMTDGSRAGSGDRPGSDPRSQGLLARLEEPIPMHFAGPPGQARRADPDALRQTDAARGRLEVHPLRHGGRGR
jgi:hypothetical protein